MRPMRGIARLAMIFLLGSVPLRALPQGPRQSPRRRVQEPLQARAIAYRSVQYGVASWYGPGLRWRRTASGVRFDDRQLTAAHRSLPLGTQVKVTNLRNGRSVIVKVTDRGPWVRGRLIDLSRAAADRLGFRHQGVAPVKVAVVHKPVAHSQKPPAGGGGTAAGDSLQAGANHAAVPQTQDRNGGAQ